MSQVRKKIHVQVDKWTVLELDVFVLNINFLHKLKVIWTNW